MFIELTEWDNRPDYLRAKAYEWCSVICTNYSDIDDGEKLLFLALEISFRGLDPQCQWTDVQPVQTKHYRHMADIVFNSGDGEVIADLLQAWATCSSSQRSRGLPNMCAKHLVRLERVDHASKRLRRLIIHTIGCLGFRPFERAGVEGFTALLERLVVCVDDVSDAHSRIRWLPLLLGVVRSPDGWRSLGYPHWELILELSVTGTLFLRDPIKHELGIMVSLEEQRDWDRLECWVCFGWSILRPTIDSVLESLERVTLSLLRQRPGIAEKLKQLLQRPAIGDVSECLELFGEIRKRAGLHTVSQPETP